ncbi:MAG: serine/threonine protein kinase [Labilithrix sp.]|nr:serine/threonine protein kinase [Labilithrix sp.]
MNSQGSPGLVAELPRPGDLIAGKYRVDAVIGTGGMGVVLGAEDTSLGRKVAIKFLAPQKADREGAVARFLREARAAASIQSEHVVRIHEVGAQPNGASYIVMEHLVGSDLAVMLQARGPLAVDEAVDHVLQACEAIGEAHGRGIVHRDLKPQNLFLTRRPDGSPIVKVLDFGISKAIDAQSPNLTATDMIMGTPLYMSPEQVRSLKSVDHRSDIWSLGAILFELLTQSPIYDAATASALCAAIAVDPPIPLRARRPDAPAELEAVILRCLQKDPAGRYADVAALAQALAPFASARGRVHAMNVAQIVRAGSMTGGFAQAAHAPAPSPYVPTTHGGQLLSPVGAPVGLGFDPTVGTSGVGSALPPGAFGAGYHPPTQQGWQQGGALAGKPPPARGGGGLAVVAVLGALALVLLLGLGGGGYYVYSRGLAKGHTTTGESETDPVATASSGIALPPSAAPLPSAASTAAAPAPPASKKPAAGATAAKDAGAAPRASTRTSRGRSASPRGSATSIRCSSAPTTRRPTRMQSG